MITRHDSDTTLLESENRLPLAGPHSQDTLPTLKVAEEPQFFGTFDQDRTQFSHTSTSELPLLKSLESFKVLTECPLIIMLLFQVYPKFISRNIPPILPHMMTVLGLTLPYHASRLHKVRFREFLASQVR